MGVDGEAEGQQEEDGDTPGKIAFAHVAYKPFDSHISRQVGKVYPR